MIPVHVDQVVKRFGPVRALDGVSVSIERGEIFFLLGPSGCGKTTLLRSIAGFYRPERGTIRFGDRDVTNLPPQKRETGMVFQSYALWPHMTVESNVAFGLSVRGIRRAERRKRVAEALELVRMGAFARRKPNQLSGGQQQRVALARALVIRPQCLLLDEPLSNLDAKLRNEMRAEIRRLCRQFELTTIYVTHDQKEALTIADRLAVMFDGRVGQMGTPQEVYQRPATREIADFLGEANFVPTTRRCDETTFETPLGRIRSDVASDFASKADSGAPSESSSSSATTLLIRPEAIRLLSGEAKATEPPNTVEARVAELTYLGEAIQVTLRSADVMLTAKLAESNAHTRPAIGDTVRVAVDPADVVPLVDRSA